MKIRLLNGEFQNPPDEYAARLIDRGFAFPVEDAGAPAADGAEAASEAVEAETVREPAEAGTASEPTEAEPAGEPAGEPAKPARRTEPGRKSKGKTGKGRA